MAVYLVKQQSSTVLLQRLRAKGIRNPDHSRALSKNGDALIQHIKADIDIMYKHFEYSFISKRIVFDCNFSFKHISGFLLFDIKTLGCFSLTLVSVCMCVGVCVCVFVLLTYSQGEAHSRPRQ